MERVVVTGMGLVSPLGCGVKKVWPSLLSGTSGIRTIDHFDTEGMDCKVAGVLSRDPQDPSFFDFDTVVSSSIQRKMDRFVVYALAAAHEALQDADWAPQTAEDQENSGVLIGSGIGGLPAIGETHTVLMERGPKRVSPFFIPSALINLASGQVSIAHGLKGPNHSVVTACATGAHAIGDAARMIQWGDASVMLAGGTEAAVCPLGLAGFGAMRALSTGFNDTPAVASRPWDQKRDGFVMGEGAGLLVLESLTHAQNRGAKIYAEYVGYGLSGDAHHMTAPSGDGAYRAMRMALKRANISPDQVDYVNAHGTSTPLGDKVEIDAMRRLFQEHMPRLAISSTKSSIGHLLGAAGGVEAIFSILSLCDQQVPPTCHLDHPDDEFQDLNLVPHKAQARDVEYVLSNSFGFGGTNASLIFKRWNDQ